MVKFGSSLDRCLEEVHRALLGESDPVKVLEYDVLPQLKELKRLQDQLVERRLESHN